MDNNNLPTRTQLHRSQKKTKKHFYKRWWFWGIIFILLLAAGGFGGMKMTSTGPFSQKTTKVAKKKATPKKKVAKKTGLTLKQYNGIYLSQTDGLSQEILGKLFGEPNSTSTSTVQNISTNVVTWNKIADGQLGSNLTVNFTNDHAISKAITGLKVTRNKKLSLADYEKIQNGDSETQLLQNLGKPNGYAESSVNNTTQKEYTYSSGLKGETGANFIVTITNDTVSGKSQTGLK
ncbi:hypothetical protein FD29_GL001881 [Companilactobacillus mindensis DSM 14500]|jgi:hypothetical protein|uniref:DUF3862 domain-containing protein n=1 Tax=Companilactobacillus mindensis DSM 14500 TaxID=1423770 RepID=A0A0R1QXI2_9LACO|nr:DUF3862 domain-containing protein [Companilactobacillus mindensis]KRL45880.1 hypothetical protein FD29_GL001881 [Companilactobacillus mindensis DSM 14500]GEO77742.1 hypothetical protein LMI01_00730 [Companilactobacillus mindensis]